MGRIVTSVIVANALQPRKEIEFDALVDTGTAGLVLPRAWKRRLGNLTVARTADLGTADQRVVKGEVCGPVRIRIEGFETVFGEVTFLEMEQRNGFEPLLGYIVLEQSQAAVDMLGHRLVKVKHLDLK